MKGNFKKLMDEFYLIQCKNWVKSEVEGNSGAGATLEMLLGKRLDAASLPDYLGIELKTKSIYSNYAIGLFNAVLDNEPNQMDKLFERCSWKCTRNGGENELYDVIDTMGYSNEHRKYSFKLELDWEKEKVNLLIYHNWDKYHVKNNMSWSFKELELRLNKKLSYLALIHYDRYTDPKTKEIYFKYLDIAIYKLKSFTEFLELLDKGIIKVELKMFKYKEGPNKGYFRNKETTFVIDEENIKYLFDRINL